MIFWQVAKPKGKFTKVLNSLDGPSIFYMDVVEAFKFIKKMESFYTKEDVLHEREYGNWDERND